MRLTCRCTKSHCGHFCSGRFQTFWEKRGKTIYFCTSNFSKTFLGWIARFVLLTPCSDTTRLAAPACCHYLLIADRKWWQMTEEVATQRESIFPAAAWTFSGKEEVRRSFSTQGILKTAISAHLSVIASSSKAIPQCACYVEPSSCCEKTHPTWSTFPLWNTSWHTSLRNCCGAMFCSIDDNENCSRVLFALFHLLPCYIVEFQPCVMLVYLPWGIYLLPPLHPPLQNNTPLAPNETPYLLPLLEGMNTNRETGEGRQTEPQRPLEPSSAQIITHTRLTEGQIMGPINI